MKDITNFALEYALKHGAQQARINYTSSVQSSFNFLNDTLDKLQHS